MSIAQQKIWQTLPKISEDFISQFPEYSRVVLQLLANRGLKKKDEIEAFLNPDHKKNIHDPFLFKDMEAAVELIIKHIKEQNKILVYGDYDADGVTATAVLYETLTTLRGDVGAYLPDRVSEGYGLNKDALKEIFDAGAKLIITVDTGIRNKEEVEYAKELGLDIIITDHHVAPDSKDELPNCLIVNPMVEGEKYPFKFLAGVGVAFKVAKAIISKAKIAGEDKRKLEAQILDLAAIGTVADCVSLLGENRALVQRGLDVLNNTKRLGLNKLIEAVQLSGGRKLDAWNIGWQIAPRINAAGRMDHANTAFELLITENIEEAKMIARRLNDRNMERQKITGEIVEEVEKQVKENDTIIIGLYEDVDENKAWNEGVIVLVAGKICEKYYRPTLVITKSEDGYKGSGRSIDELNIIKVIEEVSDLLDKYGGHAGACGFSLRQESLDDFVKKVKQIVKKKLKSVNLTPKLKIEAELGLKEINESLLEEINRFAPFGQDNERPKFVSYNAAVVDIINMGIDGQHIKLRIKNGNSSVLSAVGFGQAQDWQHLTIGDKIDIVYYMELNEFNGRREAQLKIIDIKHNANVAN